MIILHAWNMLGINYETLLYHHLYRRKSENIHFNIIRCGWSSIQSSVNYSKKAIKTITEKCQ